VGLGHHQNFSGMQPLHHLAPSPGPRYRAGDLIGAVTSTPLDLLVGVSSTFGATWCGARPWAGEWGICPQGGTQFPRGQLRGDVGFLGFYHGERGPVPGAFLLERRKRSPSVQVASALSWLRRLVFLPLYPSVNHHGLLEGRRSRTCGKSDRGARHTPFHAPHSTSLIVS